MRNNEGKKERDVALPSHFAEGFPTAPRHRGVQYGYLHAGLSRQCHGWLGVGVVVNSAVQADTSSNVGIASSNSSTVSRRPIRSATVPGMR